MNRLPIAYVSDRTAPTRWLQFLNELLYEEDIPALQEYIGYCLLPVTKAQKMLLMVGKGGEGKIQNRADSSRIVRQTVCTQAVCKR